jgi:recombination protein RecT
MAKQEIQNINTQIEKPKTLASLLQSEMVKKRLEDILGKRSSTFATSVIQIANSNDLLKKADPQSILNSALLATTLELPLNNSLGFAYIVPFNNKQKDGSFKVEAQFQLGAKGLQQLAVRSGQYKDLYAKAVYEGQVVEDDSFLGYHFEWKNKTSDIVIGYASYFKLTSGFESIFYMSVQEITDHAKKYSQTFKRYGSGLWKDDFEKMAKKTVLKLLLNSGKAPLSVEMQNAVTADQAVIKEYNDDNTIDVDYVDGTDIEPTGDEKKEDLKEIIVEGKIENPIKDMP